MNSPSASPSLPTLSLTSGLSDGIEPAFNYTWAGVACLVGLIIYVSTRPKDPLDAIPSLGRTGFFTSYIDAFYFVKNAKEVLQKGYNKYQPGVFRVPEFNHWHVVVAGPQLTEELRKAADDELSLSEGVKNLLAVDWTLGSNVVTNGYHIPIIRSQLTRNLGNLFSSIREEMLLAFDDNIPITEDWTRIKALDTIMTIVARTSNRVFVGAPICRHPEYIAIAKQFTLDVIIGAKIIGLFPKFLKPLVARFCTNVPKSITIALKHLQPTIERRQAQMAEHGPDYPDKPLDMLSWFMDEAQGEELTVTNLTRRILTLNFVSIHSSSTSFTQILFELALRPEYIQPLREEIEAVVAEHGWNKVALNSMCKLDSFIKECQRFRAGGLSMGRRAVKDYTFSDGTRVPKGTYVSVATSRHFDEEAYTNASSFNGFRFSEEKGTNNQLVATSLDFVAFGHGRHACPGRFFAANELKLMLAHTLLTYDIKMDAPPREMWFGHLRLIDDKADVLFRKRRV
ncbi:cytochrome P450 [Ramaria rubella]|nr:cytochrome P450 [Ramaria rubella]